MYSEALLRVRFLSFFPSSLVLQIVMIYMHRIPGVVNRQDVSEKKYSILAWKGDSLP